MRDILLKETQSYSYSDIISGLKSGKLQPAYHDLASFDVILSQDQLVYGASRIRDPNSFNHLHTLLPLSLSNNFTISYRPTNQCMGLLPLSRMTPAPPLDSYGVDFADPFFIQRQSPESQLESKSMQCT